MHRGKAKRRRREVRHRKPWFLPESKQPQTLEALCKRLGIEDAVEDPAFEKVTWGKVECAADLAPAGAALVPGREADAMRELRARDVFLPILDRTKDEFCGEAKYGGRTDIFENVFELPETVTSNSEVCSECGRGDALTLTCMPNAARLLYSRSPVDAEDTVL